MRKTLFTSLSPNLQKDDFFVAARLLFQPWKWKRGNAQIKLKKKIIKMFSAKGVYCFESGRTSLEKILRAGEIREGDEVLLQSYTCVAVPDSVIWNGARPVYVDVKDDFTMSPSDLENKITGRSKAVIIQHTFGAPAEVESLMAIARKNNLLVIEDCAHAIGVTYKGQLVGTFGDAAIVSFGRDKVISSVFGGAAIIHSSKIDEKISELFLKTKTPSLYWIIRQLLHPILTFVVKLTYDFFSLGKFFMKMLRVTKLLSFAVQPGEKRGERPSFHSQLMPNALCELALHQLDKLEYLNDHRTILSKIYENKLIQTKYILPKNEEGAIFLRYTIMCENRDEILQKAKQQKILLGDWYTTVIAPYGVDYSSIYFNKKNTPNAKRFAEKSINLPTSINISDNDAGKICDFLLKQL